MRKIIALAAAEVIIMAALAVCHTAWASETSSTGKTYTVGYISQPCYISKTPDGRVEGLIAEIWMEIAKRARLNYTFREFKDPAELREKLTAGELDFFLNGIQRTTENAEVAAFSHVYHVSNLTILLIRAWNLRFMENFKAISVVWSGIVLQIFVLFIAVAFIYANILWFLERDTAVVKDYKKGVFDAMWCIIAVETTIGFGDIVPGKISARVFSVVVWFTGLLLITLISAEIISEFSTNKIHFKIRVFSELKNNTVAIPNDAAIIDEMNDIGAKLVPVSNYKDIYDLLKTGKADAAVLQYLPAMELAQRASENALEAHTIKSTTYELQWQAGLSRRTIDEGLFDEINNIIFDMRGDGSIAAMYDKWLP
ncbi:MAG: transporter substrate-binding domain-containing protein [Nitrospirae bacterium]|nr:transporter substrate-binding domain-containing protein [Nitrospirota bacterium]